MTVLSWILSTCAWAAEPSAASSRGTWEVPLPPVPAVVQAGSSHTSHVSLEAPGEVPEVDRVRGVSWVFGDRAQRGTEADGRFTHTWSVPRASGRVSVGLDFDVGGTTQKGPRKAVQIVDPPAALSWADVEAGCAIETQCRPLPAGTFVQLPEGSDWTVSRRGETSVSTLSVAIRSADGRLTSIGLGDETFETLVGASLCVSPNACLVRSETTLNEQIDFVVDGVPLADPLVLAIPVRPTTWWVCWGTLIMQSAVVGLVAFFGYGFYRPLRFGARSGSRFPSAVEATPGERLRMMGSPKRRIRPRARGGFWWSDQVAYFSEELSQVRNAAGAVVTVRIVRTAPRGGVEITEPCAWISARQKLRRSKMPFRNGASARDYKWEDVPAAGEALQRGYVYVLPGSSVRTVFVFD